VKTSDGCIDILTLGAFLEFATAVSRPHYYRTISNHEQEEENVARWKYRQLLRWYQFEYVAKADGAYVDINFLANFILVQFAVALVKYAKKFEKDLSGGHLNAKSLRAAVLNHLLQDWPELTEAFRQKEKDEGLVQPLVWHGVEFEISRRRGINALQDSLVQPLYIPLPPDDDSSDENQDDDQDSGRAKRKRDDGAGRG
jgi:hypothetical protein